MIGGLIQEREIYNVTKVPLLGDIPLLGYLFKYTTQAEEEDQPADPAHAVHHQGPARSRSTIRERKVREHDEFVASFAHLNDMKYEPKIDYRRKRGLVEEINRAVEAIDDDIEARKQLHAPVHVQGGAVQ